MLTEGHFELFIHKNVEGDPTIYSKTPGLNEDQLIKNSNKIYCYIDKYNSHEIKCIPWLDLLAQQTLNKKIEKINNDARFGSITILNPIFSLPVLWSEQKYLKPDVFQTFSSFRKKMT